MTVAYMNVVGAPKVRGAKDHKRKVCLIREKIGKHRELFYASRLCTCMSDLPCQPAGRAALRINKSLTKFEGTFLLT